MGAEVNRSTIAELAEAAGVSVSTVNRLLANPESVRAETADRIIETAQRVGFYGLGALRERKRAALPQRTLGFLMQQSHRALYQMWAEAIVATAARRADAVIDPKVRFEDDLSPKLSPRTCVTSAEKSTPSRSSRPITPW